MNLLLRNLYFDETAINGAGATYDVVFEGPRSGTVTYSDEGMPLYFNTDSDDYRLWIGESALKSFVAESVVGVFMDQLGVGS